MSLDDEGAQKQLDNFTKTVDDLGDALAKTESQKPFSGLSGHVEKLRNTFSNIKEVGSVALHSLGEAAEKIGSVFATIGEAGVKAFKAVGTAAAAATKKLLQASGEVAEYGDNIDKLSQSMGISAESYQEWDAVLQHSGTSMESMKSGMQTLTKAAATNSKAFEKLGISQEDLASMSREDLFSATITALQGMEDETQRTLIASQLLGDSAADLGALLNTSAEDTQAMKNRVRELGGVMSNDAVAAASQYQDSLQDLQTAFSGMSRGFIAEFLPGISTVMDGLTEIFSGDPDSGLEKIKSGINSIVSTISEILPEIIQLGSEIIVTLAKAITDNLPALLTSAGETILAIATGLIDNLPEIIQTGLDVILALALGIADAIPELIPTIVDVVLEIVDTLTDPDTLGALVDASIAIIIALAVGLIDALPKLLEKAPEIIQNLVTAIIENVPKLFEAALKIITELVKGITDNFYRLTKAAWEIVQTILDGIGDIFSKMIDIGSNIVSGIWQGISDGYTWITNKISGWVGDVLGFFKRILGIASPSKVFASIGDFMMQGLAVGLDDGTKYALKATERAVSSIEDAASFALPAVRLPVSWTLPRTSFGNLLPTSRTFTAAAALEGAGVGQSTNPLGSLENIVAAFRQALQGLDQPIYQVKVFLDSREIQAGQQRLARVSGR